MSSVPQGFCEWGGRRIGDGLILIVDGPRAVEVLPDIDVGLGIGAAPRTRWDVEDQAAETDCVVVEDGGGIAESQDTAKIQLSYGPEGRARLGCSFLKALVEAIDP